MVFLDESADVSRARFKTSPFRLSEERQGQSAANPQAIRVFSANFPKAEASELVIENPPGKAFRTLPVRPFPVRGSA
jgi:hypothetical protein